MKMNRSKIVIITVCSILLGAGITYQNCGQINQQPDSSDSNVKSSEISQLQAAAGDSPKSKPAAERGFKELIDDVGVIFVGKALSAYSAFSDDKEMIYTIVTFQKEDVLKGTIGESTVELRFAGGTIGEETVKAVGMPYFEKDKSYVLFLHDNINPYRTISPVYGMEAGQFVIQQEKDKTERVYLPNGAKIIGYDKTKDQLDSAYLAPPRKNIPRAADSNQDKLVDENDPKKLAQSGITKDAFVQIISGIVKESGLSGSAYRNMKKEEMTKPIILSIVKAPQIETAADQKGVK
jgi:hypothetical protein